MPRTTSVPDERPVIYCVIPAAGVGKRMQSNVPKQYLPINDKCVLEHTIERLSAMPFIAHIYVAISPEDQYFKDLKLPARVTAVAGGKERVDSVLAGINSLTEQHRQQDDNHAPWVLVHDAARPNITQSDVEKLVAHCLDKGCGGILATPVRDTMKRGEGVIDHTEPREHLWHALTPQFFPLAQLRQALSDGLTAGANITDEASAIEFAAQPVLLVEGRADNLKITKPEDLALATFYLSQTAAQT